MNNESTPTVSTVTEADVASFLKNAHAFHKLPVWSALNCSAECNDYNYKGSERSRFSVYGHADKEMTAFVHGAGETIAEAVAAFNLRCPPTGAELAAKKRADAAKLLAEADALTATPAPTS